MQPPNAWQEVIHAWAENDLTLLTVENDKSIARECDALRALVVREAFSNTQKGLTQALGRFGHFLGTHGASPTFAALTIDSLRKAWGELSQDASWIERARATVFESYVLARLAEEKEIAAKAWSPETTTVIVDPSTATVAAAPPFDDGEKMSAWADRVVAHLSRKGVRTVVASGSPLAIVALKSACGVAGVSFREAPRVTK